MDAVDETFILLLLSDSNLPTGSFVASAGLESYSKHGLSHGESDKIMTFIRSSLNSYAHTALPFVSDTHLLISSLDTHVDIDIHLKSLRKLDDIYHVMTPNHVSRRASESQGVALLNLYSKGFSKPKSTMVDAETDNTLGVIVDRYKLFVRREEAHGHLPVCWGILTGALGLSLGLSYALNACSSADNTTQKDLNIFICFFKHDPCSPQQCV